jgi:hypothetical protein
MWTRPLTSPSGWSAASRGRREPWASNLPGHRDLRASLRAYDDADLDDPVIPAAKAVARLWEKYEVLCAMLHPVGYRPGELHLSPDPACRAWWRPPA